MEIRRILYGDINEEFLAALSALKDPGLTVEEARRIYACAASFHEWPQFGRVYVAAENEKIFGVATLILEKKFLHRGGIVGHIEDVAVHPDNQGKGLGKLLVETLVSEARIAGAYKVILDCDPKNVEFYKKMGFYTADVHMRIDL